MPPTPRVTVKLRLTLTHSAILSPINKGHFAEFANTIRDYGMQSTDPELLLRVKASMWAVGNVGSMEPGAPFLESCNVVEDIVQIAQEHNVMSMRGTAFFVLGLISRSIHGLEILSECGWDSNLNSRGNSIGFCIPNDLSKFFSFKPWKHTAIPTIQLPDTQKTILTPPPPSAARPPLEREELPPANDDAAVNARILELIVDLGNMILFKRAMTELKEIKQRKAPGFRDPRLFKKVMAMFEYNNYRLPIRRMVIELFDKRVLRQIVFEEDLEDDDEDQDDTAKPQEVVEEGDEEDEEEEEYEGADGHADHERDGNVSSSGDEVRTERQRSISEPQELLPEGRVMNRLEAWEPRHTAATYGIDSSVDRHRSISDPPDLEQDTRMRSSHDDSSSSEDENDRMLEKNRGAPHTAALNVSFAARQARSNSGVSNNSASSMEDRRARRF